MDTFSNTPDDNPLKVRRGRVASVDLYEVKDSELDILEKGSPATLQLNFAIFLLSLAFSSIAALCTATFSSPIAQDIFTFIAVIGILLGGYLVISWWRTRTSITGLITAIRLRIDAPVNPEGTPKVSKSKTKREIKETEPEG
jgi:hypothetical protein